MVEFGGLGCQGQVVGGQDPPLLHGGQLPAFVVVGAAHPVGGRDDGAGGDVGARAVVQDDRARGRHGRRGGGLGGGRGRLVGKLGGVVVEAAGRQDGDQGHGGEG